MRVDSNFIIFVDHEEWYTFKIGIGYVPTDKAPKKAVDAMKEYNSYTYKWDLNMEPSA